MVWRLLRERAGLSATQLGDELRVSKTFVNNLEQGKKANTTDAILERASAFFGVSKLVLTWDGGELPAALVTFLRDEGLEGKIDPIHLAQLATFEKVLGRAPKAHEYGTFYHLLLGPARGNVGPLK